ncbi:MAG: TIGR03960 family B12-binding radical SAM protein [Clostridiales bacterium]|nr:TIGR03960 family B12-binding radical SAM protein [Clostridiales bacterium]
MEKLALSDEILLSVEKPARYIGNEINMVRKDPENVDLRAVFAFPDVYEIGMSHLGLQILQHMFNQREDVYCERVFSPWPDLHRIMKEQGIPLFALESQDPIKDFDWLLITLQYEMCYPNILQILGLAGIPFKSCDRTEADPIVIGGGPCAYNPEPIADFFDIFYIGEGETVYDELIDLYKKHKHGLINSRHVYKCDATGNRIADNKKNADNPGINEKGDALNKDADIKEYTESCIADDRKNKGGFGKNKKCSGFSRAAFLREASHIPGIYVPSLYEVIYNDDGTIASFTPKYEDVPATVTRQVVSDMSKIVYPDKPIVPYVQATQDRVTLEIQRGCIRGCRFCQAGMIYRPLRERSLEHMESLAESMLKSTGYDEISLSSLSSSDYRYLPELLNFLIDNFKKDHVNISLPSLRIDNFSLDVMSKVQDIKKSSLTFAPEAGSQRMRDVINKGLTEEEILSGAGTAFEGGWQKVKLYFMLGLPTETEEDQRAIAQLAERIAEKYYDIPKDKRMGKCQITVSTSFFVPKPCTPFQWCPICTKEDFLGRARAVNESVKAQKNRKSIRYNWHNADITLIEGILARGDRRLADALIKVYEKGGIFPAWTEYYVDSKWQEAFEECGIDVSFYTTRERDRDEILPWDFIDTGVSREYLWKEWQRALAGEVTPNCREQCRGCGARRFHGGVCYETED